MPYKNQIISTHTSVMSSGFNGAVRLCVLGLAVHFSLLASSITPAGLAPGSTYRILFVTSQTTDATSTNINDYNTFVNDSANNLAGDTGSVLASLGATWTVFGGTSTSIGYAGYQADPNVPVYDVNGDLIAATYADLFFPGSGHIDTAVDLTQTGVVFSGSLAWTGIQSNGNANPSSQALGGGAPGYGNPLSTSSTWITNYAFDQANTVAGSFYGLSSELVYSSTPEPSTIWSITGGIAALGWLIRKRRRA